MKLARAVGILVLLAAMVSAGLIPAFSSARVLAGEGESPVGGDETPAYLIIEIYGLLLRESVKHPEPAVLVQSAIDGLLNGLRDGYADYYTPNALEDFRSTFDGEFGGIGVRVRADASGYLIVADVLPGYPAEGAGLKPGDKIIAVDGLTIVGQGLGAAEKIRGEPGTKVLLTIVRTSRSSGD